MPNGEVITVIEVLSYANEQPVGALLKGVYDRAGYDLILDYNKPPVPPLNEADTAWARELLAGISE